MQRIQILFPDPVMARLRAASRLEDRPVSELVRRAVEHWLGQKPPADQAVTPGRKIPCFRGGKVLIAADRLKDSIYEDDEQS